MKKIQKEQLAVIERQLYNKARDIDVAIYNALTEEDGKEFVLDCLTMYRNHDGGFGNALEIDNYNPNSSVYQTYEALRILDMLDFDYNCKNELYLDLVNKAMNYLYNRIGRKDNMWNPVVETNNDYAHSEEYTFYSNALDTWRFHPTAAILGYTLTLVSPTKAYYKKALKELGFAFSYFFEKENLTIYDFISFNSLLGSLKKADVCHQEQEKIEEKLKNEAEKRLGEEGFSIFYLSNCRLEGKLAEEMDRALDTLIEDIAPHGLWEHKKGWGSIRYPEADSAMLKWIGCESVNNLVLLYKFDRIER